jgi:hypothetical protein
MSSLLFVQFQSTNKPFRTQAFSIIGEHATHYTMNYQWKGYNLQLKTNELEGHTK